jgi:hypothetical protein
MSRHESRRKAEPAPTECSVREPKPEVVDASLDLASFQGEVAAGIDKMAKAGGVAAIFGE